MLDEAANFLAIVDRWLNFAKPAVLVSIPASDLLGKRMSTTTGNALGHHVIAAFQEPKQFSIAAGTAIHAPDDTMRMQIR